MPRCHYRTPDTGRSLVRHLQGRPPPREEQPQRPAPKPRETDRKGINGASGPSPGVQGQFRPCVISGKWRSFLNAHRTGMTVRISFISLLTPHDAIHVPGQPNSRDLREITHQHAGNAVLSLGSHSPRGPSERSHPTCTCHPVRRARRWEPGLVTCRLPTPPSGLWPAGTQHDGGVGRTGPRTEPPPS